MGSKITYQRKISTQQNQLISYRNFVKGTDEITVLKPIYSLNYTYSMI
jgi:hypothetical protein